MKIEEYKAKIATQAEYEEFRKNWKQGDEIPDSIRAFVVDQAKKEFLETTAEIQRILQKYKK